MRQILVQRDDEIAHRALSGNLITTQLRDRNWQQQQRRCKDRRDNTCGVDLQRQMAAIGLHHAALRCAFGILDQHPPLAALHEHDEQCQQHKHQEEADNQETADRTGARTFEQVDEQSRHLRDNPRHNNQRNPVTNAARGNLLAQPHQKHRAADQADRRNNTEHHAGLYDRCNAVCCRQRFQASSQKIALQASQENGAITRILVEFLASTLAFFFDCGECWRQRRRQLHHDGGGDVRHHAKRDQAHTFERPARERIEDVEHAPACIILIEQSLRNRVDARQRHKAQHSENDKRADGKPDALLKICSLPEL